MTDNKDKTEQPQTIEKEQGALKGGQRLEAPEKVLERKERLDEDRIVSAELRREIEMMQIDDNVKKIAEQKAQKISFLGEEEKIKHLLKLAREKGVIFAVHVARKMNEPYLLDILHDTLAQEGFYKDFTK